MSRKSRWVVRAVAAVAVCAVGAVAYDWGIIPPFQRYWVAIPPATATPEQVTLAYLRALDAHDTSTAHALSTKAHRPETDMWLRSTTGISDINIGDSRGEGWVTVATSFTTHGGDGSFVDGALWEYTLTKDSHSGRWLINSEGTG
ncbi:hypothetical protein GCM10023194_18870 [Planotetraspora phitsanulokensis]|uniref:Uncharacterized protein n=1 Tax=Planotetraspora phitsanulokensis TaxID=575192 RepID=A0A8J3U9V2_9ACTN|nr:hypothetical protein [Planotetraspora phitsanulokensis]GII39481.1 hypothetical protein Pph01_44840 [Planotetraspora phitsanulokensis]